MKIFYVKIFISDMSKNIITQKFHKLNANYSTYHPFSCNLGHTPC